MIKVPRSLFETLAPHENGRLKRDRSPQAIPLQMRRCRRAHDSLRFNRHIYCVHQIFKTARFACALWMQKGESYRPARSRVSDPENLRPRTWPRCTVEAMNLIHIDFLLSYPPSFSSSSYGSSVCVVALTAVIGSEDLCSRQCVECRIVLPFIILAFRIV
jgi:hypothetical protein